MATKYPEWLNWSEHGKKIGEASDGSPALKALDDIFNELGLHPRGDDGARMALVCMAFDRVAADMREAITACLGTLQKYQNQHHERLEALEKRNTADDHYWKRLAEQVEAVARPLTGYSPTWPSRKKKEEPEPYCWKIPETLMKDFIAFVDRVMVADSDTPAHVFEDDAHELLKRWDWWKVQPAGAKGETC